MTPLLVPTLADPGAGPGADLTADAALADAQLAEVALAAAGLSAKDRQFINRFSYGYTTKIASQVRAAGGGRAWFERQLSPGSIKDGPGNAVDDWFPVLWYKPAKLWQRAQNDITPSWILMADMGRWTMMRRAKSNRQLLEVMTDFWSNMLHIPLGDDEAWPYRISYDKLIRKHALGRFDDMLAAAIVHQSMGLYLDNATSTKDAPNENLGRELLELHSVGLDAGYTERDVKMSSRMLTGYRVDLWWPEFRSYYSKTDHWTGRIRVLDFSHPNKDGDGRKATDKYLRYLAQHPATAKRIARRLCVKFVHDEPSSDLVNTVARAYRRSGTNIATTLRAMVSHPEFAASSGEKVRMPLDDTIATIRALRIKPAKPKNDSSFARSIYWVAQGQGQTPYSWPAPNGFPEVDAAWSGPGRVLDSFSVHRSLTMAWWPSQGARWRKPAAWAPDTAMDFGKVIDYVSLQLHGKKAPKRVKNGISARMGIPLGRRTTPSTLLESDGIRIKQILVSLLDSPTQMTR
ncbi:MAG: DUF1800 domain-containing protein [Nocardioides sp.]